MARQILKIESLKAHFDRCCVELAMSKKQSASLVKNFGKDPYDLETYIDNFIGSFINLVCRQSGHELERFSFAGTHTAKLVIAYLPLEYQQQFEDNFNRLLQIVPETFFSFVQGGNNQPEQIDRIFSSYLSHQQLGSKLAQQPKPVNHKTKI